MSRGDSRRISRNGGRFFGRRVNCEQVPLLPAWIVGRMFDDPRKTPYLLTWTSRWDGTVQEAVRISAKIEPPVQFPPNWTDVVEINRTDGTRNFIRTILRALPSSGARTRLLVCSYCEIPRRALYAWEPGGQYTSSVYRSNWKCRSCAKLRYASEGGALVLRSRGTIARLLELKFGRCRPDRPELWYPEISTSLREAADVVRCEFRDVGSR